MSAYTEEMKPRRAAIGVLGTWTIVGLLLLFNIPVLGWLICIVMAFASKNANIRNLARATLVFIAIAIGVIALAIYAVTHLIGEFMSISSDSVDGFIMDIYRLSRYAKLFSIGDIFTVFSA